MLHSSGLCTKSSPDMQCHIGDQGRTLNIKDVSVTHHTHGLTTLQFIRLWVIEDNQNLSLDIPFYLLFAWNGPISDVETIGYHGFTTCEASTDLITLPTAQHCPGE